MEYCILLLEERETQLPIQATEHFYFLIFQSKTRAIPTVKSRELAGDCGRGKTATTGPQKGNRTILSARELLSGVFSYPISIEDKNFHCQNL